MLIDWKQGWEPVWAHWFDPLANWPSIGSRPPLKLAVNRYHKHLGKVPRSPSLSSRANSWWTDWSWNLNRHPPQRYLHSSTRALMVFLLRMWSRPPISILHRHWLEHRSNPSCQSDMRSGVLYDQLSLLHWCLLLIIDSIQLLLIDRYVRLT